MLTRLRTVLPSWARSVARKVRSADRQRVLLIGCIATGHTLGALAFAAAENWTALIWVMIASAYAWLCLSRIRDRKNSETLLDISVAAGTWCGSCYSHTAITHVVNGVTFHGSAELARNTHCMICGKDSGQTP